MLDNIRAHSLMVARVASVLLQELTNHLGPDSSVFASKKLVLAGALLHDIAKTPCLKNRCDHARHGRDICIQLGFPEVAEVVREHVTLTEFSLERYNKGLFLAKELVYYADKRVRHDEIVSLEERLEYILVNYGNNDPGRYSQIRANFDKCLQLEVCLFSATAIEADDIKASVNSTLFC